MRRWLGLIICYGLISACALSPLHIAPKPKAAYGLSEIQPAQSFEVEIVNQLGTQVIGSRGGVYQNSSLIQLDASFDVALEKAVRFSLVGMGLIPYAQLAANDSDLEPDLLIRIVLEKLRSSCRSPLLPNSLEQSLVLELQIDKQGKRYQQRFEQKASKRFAKLPSAQDHQQAVAELLENSLKQVYQSPAALAFIQGL